MLLTVRIPPKARLNIRRSRMDWATSLGVPESVSSNSGTTTRFMLDLRQLFFQQLLIVEVGIVAVARQQFVVGSQLNHTAFVQYGDAVSIAHGGNAMGDKNGGTVAHDFAQVVEDFFFSI